MKKDSGRTKLFLKYILGTSTMPWLLTAAGIIVVLIIIVTIGQCGKDNSVNVYTNDKIDITPNIITSIKDIGEWEFLSINDEELVDTVRHKLFGDDQLARIYYGTLRLGLDLHETGKDWIRASGDSVIVTLPAIKLLDQNFIDETRTRAFLESGKWSHQDRADLSNIRSAEQNAITQFRNLMQSMGFNNIKIRFEQTNKKNDRHTK